MEIVLQNIYFLLLANLSKHNTASFTNFNSSVSLFNRFITILKGTPSSYCFASFFFFTEHDTKYLKNDSQYLFDPSISMTSSIDLLSEANSKMARTASLFTCFSELSSKFIKICTKECNDSKLIIRVPSIIIQVVHRFSTALVVVVTRRFSSDLLCTMLTSFTFAK